MFKSVSFVFLVLLVLQLTFVEAFQNARALSAGQTNTMSTNSIATSSTTTTSLSMGLFDSFSKAFQNTEYGPPAEAIKASARHILVPTKAEAKVVLKMISTGEATFAECAQDFSTCASASQGGSLGSFSPGKMVPEFDKVIFDPETKIGELQGPILTDFGFHIIMVDKRTGGGDWY
mmetsp:Transcript_22785/g.56294  ORF Transcript_22785/g.56294 Transcript_22785/m.56294 type:complete len:176 (+) Transcript_22785:55-582(+)